MSTLCFDIICTALGMFLPQPFFRKISHRFVLINCLLKLTSTSVTVSGRTGFILTHLNISSRFLSCFRIIAFSFRFLSMRSSNFFNLSFCIFFNLDNSSFSFYIYSSPILLGVFRNCLPHSTSWTSSRCK